MFGFKVLSVSLFDAATVNISHRVSTRKSYNHKYLSLAGFLGQISQKCPGFQNIPLPNFIRPTFNIINFDLSYTTGD